MTNIGWKRAQPTPQSPFTRARPTCGTLPAAEGGIIIAAGTVAGREAAGLEGEYK
jgi:hypothetical protein